MNKLHLTRLQQLRKQFDRLKIDALYVTKPENVYYLSGFPGGDSFLFITQKKQFLITDTRYEAEVQKALGGAFRICIKKGKKNSNAWFVRDVVVSEKLNVVGFEPDALSVSSYRSLKKELGKIKLQPALHAVERLRMIKSPGEVKLIKQACEIMQSSVMKGVRGLKIGETETALASRVEGLIKKQGASGPSFPFIIACGKKAAYPHAQTGSDPIRKNALLLCDVGARFKGYASDLTRTFFIGRMTRKFKDLYSLVLEAQLAGIQQARPGERLGDVDLAVRKVFRSKGLEKYFIHSTGHGIGLEVHESPGVSLRSDSVIQEDMVFTVEPGLYFPGWGGIRIEDIVHITRRGPQSLTTIPKTLSAIQLK